MKKIISVLLFVTMIISATACNKDPQEESHSDTSYEINSDISNEISTENSDYNRTDELAELLRKNFPIVDGSTSTIPLEAGIRSDIFDISKEEAEKQVSHSTTYGSFNNLLQKYCNIILTVPLSQSQYDSAAAQGTRLEATPIAMEGFVFVVNVDNPIDSLTQQQIKDIYSGKVTNWKQVGGNDAEIIAYQRNSTSSSQNYMVAFMDKTELMEPKTDTIPITMSGLMDAIASYDNSANALGYSVYSYAAEMYVSANNVKFIKIEGVAPNTATMSDHSYPLLSYNYAVINVENPPDAPARNLIEWMLTDEGQRVVEESEYIPVADIESSLEADIVMPLLTDGTGKEKVPGYELPNTYYAVKDCDYLKYDLDNEYKEYNYRIEGLKILSLQKEINDFIRKSVVEVETDEKEAREFVKNVFGYEECYLGVNVTAECINGYLSIIVSLTYYDGSEDFTIYYYKPITAIWNLYTGKRLSFSDMFWSGEKFIKTLNNGISMELNEPYNNWGMTYELNGDFWALPEVFNTFSLSNVYFASGEGVFPHGLEINYDSYCEDMMVIGEERDMHGIWEDASIVYRSYYINDFRDYGIATAPDGCDAFWLLDSEKSGIDEEVCKKINDYMSKKIVIFSTKTLDKKYGKDNYTYGIDSMAGITFKVYGKVYIIYNGILVLLTKDYEDLETIEITAVFDYNTGNLLDPNITIDDEIIKTSDYYYDYYN
ncbi:MAG: hypothetical protein A2Y15_06310 [Clostridiales bacterium GWF2_36_10]|nr:MAG: hypothetical protein A2Y15_06310 [Clostridiales bacterium GWF2_36_10]HAN21869.1 hypothetical protein [Clostridiales bacterium]